MKSCWFEECSAIEKVVVAIGVFAKTEKSIHGIFGSILNSGRVVLSHPPTVILSSFLNHPNGLPITLPVSLFS